jgi:hypothetical protein
VAPVAGAPAGTAAAVIDVAEVRQAWNLGPLVAGRTYDGAITLANRCASPARVGIFTYGLPDLQVPPVATIPAGRALDVPFRMAAKPPADGSGVVRGQVVFWMASGSDEACAPVRVVFDTTAGIRAATALDEAREQKLRADDVAMDGCVTDVAAGPSPARPSEAECVAMLRGALKSMRSALERDGLTTPSSLSALPAVATIDTMSPSELQTLRGTLHATVAANDALAVRPPGEEWMTARQEGMKWFLSEGTIGGTSRPPADWFSGAWAKDYFSTFHVLQNSPGPATVSVRFLPNPTTSTSITASPGLASLVPWAGTRVTALPRLAGFGPSGELVPIPLGSRPAAATVARSRSRTSARRSGRSACSSPACRPS